MAVDVHWRGYIDGDMSDANNYDTGSLPVALDSLFFDEFVVNPPTKRMDVLNSFMSSRLTITLGNANDGETVTIDGKVYTWQDTLTDTDGNVKIGSGNFVSVQNLINAINNGEGAGETYASSMTFPTLDNSPQRHFRAQDDLDVPAFVIVEDMNRGGDHSTTAVTETMANGTWSANPMAGGLDFKLALCSVSPQVEYDLGSPGDPFAVSADKFLFSGLARLYHEVGSGVIAQMLIRSARPIVEGDPGVFLNNNAQPSSPINAYSKIAVASGDVVIGPRGYLASGASGTQVYIAQRDGQNDSSVLIQGPFTTHKVIAQSGSVRIVGTGSHLLIEIGSAEVTLAAITPTATQARINGGGILNYNTASTMNNAIIQAGVLDLTQTGGKKAVGNIFLGEDGVFLRRDDDHSYTLIDTTGGD